MKESRKSYLKYIFLGLFLLIEIFNYILFELNDFFQTAVFDNTILKYVSIALIVLFMSVSILIDQVSKRDKRVLIDELIAFVGIVFTLVSDTFLLLLDRYYLLGVSCFIIVQTAYFIRINLIGLKEKKHFLISLIHRIIFYIIGIIVLIIINMFNALNSIVLFYFLNLILNFIDSIFLCSKKKGSKEFNASLLLSIGLLLFIGCDTFVGIYNLFNKFYAFSWFFYLPSQVLIGLSSLNLYSLSLGGKND